MKEPKKSYENMEQTLNSDPYGYLKRLQVNTYFQAITCAEPRLRDLPEPTALTFLVALIDRLSNYCGFRLSPDQTDCVVARIIRTYRHYRTADFKLFYQLCQQARYGILEAYDRENPQIIFLWLQQYDQARMPFLETAELMYNYKERP